jgi:outer membrane lipoprotein-sorting protein
MIPRPLAIALGVALFAGALAIGRAAIAQPPAPSPAALPAEDQALVDKAAAYLEGLSQAKGRFVQTDARGDVSEGEIYLSRPGKARFEYDKPASLLIVSDGSQVLVYDKRLQTFENYPLASTPLGVFLGKTIRLGQGVVVEQVARVPGGFSITARDGRRKGLGSLTLTFSDQPMALRGWTILDAQGARTTVKIAGLAPTSGLDPALFVLRDPRFDTGPR